MKKYDGPVYQPSEGDESIKERRFNRLSQRDAAKSQFKPALKQTRSLEPTKRPTVLGQQSPSTRVTASNRQLNRGSEKYIAAEKSATQPPQPVHHSFGKKGQTATPPDDYQVPFLKQHPNQRKKLNQSSLEGIMTQRQFEPTQQPSQPKQTVAPLKQYTLQQEQKKRKQPLSNEPQDTPRVSKAEQEQAQKQVIVKPKFQPTTLPKPYQGAESSRKNKVTDRELARRLVKTREMFLLFEN